MRKHDDGTQRTGNTSETAKVVNEGFMTTKPTVSLNTILHANKKPALGSSPTPRERLHARRDRVREEEATPRKQCHARRDKVREAKKKLRKKYRIINQKHAKKREHEVEIESIKEHQSHQQDQSHHAVVTQAK
nr:hypothetical protein [Tanacetum cinerariifolium]